MGHQALQGGPRDAKPPCSLPIGQASDRSELLVVEGSGHWPYLEAPETFNRALLAFLARSEKALVP